MTYLNKELEPYIKSDGSPSQLSLSVFGPGVGESVLIGIPNDGWIIIDSLLNPSTKKPVPLEYLETLNPEAPSKLSLTIATHWHDDHIRGMSNIIERCPSTDFCMSGALNVEEFKTLACLVADFSPAPGVTSGIYEMHNILQSLKSRLPKTKIKLASGSKCLYRSACGSFKLTSLSPSDASIVTSNSEFSALLAIQKYTKSIVPHSKNLDSVALWLETPTHNILLGSDLEDTTSISTGWKAVVADSTRPSGKASLIKIPHHGSQNAHNFDVWNEMIEEDNISIVTEYSRSKLPRDSDIDRLRNLTKQLYRTSTPSSRTKIKRDRTVEKTIKQLSRNIFVASHSIGQVQVIFDEQNDPKVYLNKHAEQIL